VASLTVTASPARWPRTAWSPSSESSCSRTGAHFSSHTVSPPADVPHSLSDVLHRFPVPPMTDVEQLVFKVANFHEVSVPGLILSPPE